LIAGGIGVTPILSMAKSIIHAKVDASVYFIQAARNSKVQAFADELRNLVDVGPNVITSETVHAKYSCLFARTGCR